MTAIMIPIKDQSPIVPTSAVPFTVSDELASSMIEKMGLCHNDSSFKCYQGVIYETEGLAVSVVIHEKANMIVCQPGNKFQLLMLVNWLEHTMTTEDVVDEEVMRICQNMKRHNG